MSCYVGDAGVRVSRFVLDNTKLGSLFQAYNARHPESMFSVT